MSLGDNHACAGKTNISKIDPSSQESLRNGNTGHCFAWGFPSPWKPLPDSDPMLWKHVFPYFPWSVEHLEPSRDGETLWFGHFDWRICQWFDFTRDVYPDRAMSVCHLKPNKEPLHTRHLWSWCALPFLLKSGREECLPRWPACVTGHEHRGLVCLS